MKAFDGWIMNLEKLYETEKAYSSLFSQCENEEGVYRFTDDEIPDMYAHNFILFEKPMEKNDLNRRINAEIISRRENGCGFMRAEFNFLLDANNYSFLVQPEAAVYDIMSIETSKYALLEANKDCKVKRADTKDVIKDGRVVDIEASFISAGVDFAIRRSQRKAKVYAAKNPLSLYVCYVKEKPVGKAELFIQDNIAKIEDFDILPSYQRKGFGTTVIARLLEDANETGAFEAYLLTMSDETAKEMYTKCGFKRIGQKTSLHFKL